jgi:DNA repair exonuclease SbcCD nuclease subunit
MIRRWCFVTDNHFWARNDLAETVRINQWIADDARARGCSGTLLGGDLFEEKSVPDDRNAAGQWLLQLSDFGPVVGVMGNHEAQGDLDLFNHLNGRYPVTFHKRPGVHALPDLGIAIACLPWPHLGDLLAGLENASAGEAQEAAREAVCAITLGLGQGLDACPDCARIGLAHVSLSGAKTDHDQPLIGKELVLATADLAAMRAAIVLLGHIHAQQEIAIGDAMGVYGGAPEHCNFGEPGPKGYLIFTTDGPRVIGYERVPTPAAPMILARGAFEGGTISHTYAERDVAGADVRLEYTVGMDSRVAGRAAAEDAKRELLDRGARSVALEPVVNVETRARAPEVAAARGHLPKLEAHWKFKGFDPGARRDALLAKADYLHEATSEA